MFKNWLKQVVVVLMTLFIVASPFSAMFVMADEYKENDSDDDSGSTYYIVEGKDVDSLFDFGISDVDDLFDWIWSFKTFTVIKKASDGTYKCYFNTPNLQQLVKNQVVQLVPDGYTDTTYDVNQTQWLVDVGAGDNGATLQETAITKYGFKIPSYTYLGEYSKETMSVAGVIPSPSQGFWKFLWRGIKALFDASFLKAPDADNFNTITYLNHTYTDRDEYVVNFFHNYYLPYFVKQIAEDTVDGDEYFDNVNALLSETVTKEANESASEFIQAHQREYDLYALYERNMNTFGTNQATTTFNPTYYEFAHASVESHINDFSGFEDQDLFFGLDSTPGFRLFLVNDTKYQAAISAWLASNTDHQKIFYMANLAWGNSAGFTSYSSASIPSNPLGEDVGTTGATERVTQIYDCLVALNDGGLTSDMESNKIVPALKCTYTKMDGTVVTGGSWLDYKTYYDEQINLYDNTYMPQYNGFISDYNSWSAGHSGSTDWSTQADPSSCGNHSNYEEHWLEAKGYLDWHGPVHQGRPADWLGTYYTEVQSASTLSRPVDPRTVLTKPEEMIVWMEADTTCTIKYQTLIDEFITNADVNLHIRDLSSTANTRDTALDGHNDFLTADQATLLDQFEGAQATVAAYEAFITKFNRGTDDASDGEMEEIVYRQCMITNQGNDNECWSEAYAGGRTTITVASLYGYSGLYCLTEDYLSGGSKAGQDLSIEDTYKVIKKIQSYCGPYYNQVIANMIKLMCATAKDEGNIAPLDLMQKDDPRVMPYDTKTMLQGDAVNYTVPDPRVKLWYSHLLGNFVGSLKIGGDVLIYFHIQPTIINLAGKITEVSVFLQQLCNFDVWDSWGLSPANLWESVWITMVMGLLAAYFIIKTVMIIWKNGSKGGIRVIGGFLLLVFELGLMTVVANDPQGTWENFKNIESRVVNIGEMSTIGSDPDLAYLFGDEPDYSVTYYIPYLDTWSKYNTGYGIKADQQQIVTTSTLPEQVGVTYPKIGSNNVKQYSIMLADSFSYYGDSDSVSHSVLTASGENVNGSQVNNNAYRVVDHFLAPRVTITSSGEDTLSLSTATNENYNGEFQSGILDLFTKLLLCCLYCFLSVIKFLTFVWFWWMLYLFFFRTVINKVEKKKWTDILIETFAPLFAIIIIGIYAGIIFILTSELTGLFGLLMVIFLFFLTFVFVRYWKNLRVGAAQVFPTTLEPIYFITNFKQMQRNKHTQRANADANFNASKVGVEYSEEEQNDYEAKTRRLFKADDTIADEFSNGKGGFDKKYEQLYLDYYEQGQCRQKEYGMKVTELQRAAQAKIKAIADEGSDKEVENALKNTSGASNNTGGKRELTFQEKLDNIDNKIEYQMSHNSMEDNAEKIRKAKRAEQEQKRQAEAKSNQPKIEKPNDGKIKSGDNKPTPNDSGGGKIKK